MVRGSLPGLVAELVLDDPVMGQLASADRRLDLSERDQEVFRADLGHRSPDMLIKLMSRALQTVFARLHRSAGFQGL